MEAEFYVSFFPQETFVEPVHIIGAAFVLGLGVLYEFLQTFLTYQMYPEFNGKKIARIRLALSIVSTITMLLGILKIQNNQFVIWFLKQYREDIVSWCFQSPCR